MLSPFIMRHYRYFFAANCGGGPVQIEKYNVASSQAGPLRPSLAKAVGTDRTSILGFANGDFNLFGALCFFTGEFVCASRGKI